MAAVYKECAPHFILQDSEHLEEGGVVGMGADSNEDEEDDDESTIFI